MKILIPFLVLPLLAVASIVPERVVTPPLEIFSSKNTIQPNGDYKVSVSGLTKHDDFVLNVGSLVVPKNDFEIFTELSKAVLKVPPKDSTGLKGTAFHIGNNLVLTNLHVLDEEFSNVKSCDKFKVINHKEESYSCKSVHFCSKLHDFCLIEMAPKIIGFRKKRDVSLSLNPSLSLQNNIEPDPAKDMEDVFIAIGNSDGRGIHFSQGRGIKFEANIKVQGYNQPALKHDEYIRFWAPSTTGNSGGPLLNQNHKVIGIVKNQSSTVQSPDLHLAFNGAVPSKVVIRLVRDALKIKPEVLLKFDQSVIE
jgi:S1-C subfamily serine protease